MEFSVIGFFFLCHSCFLESGKCTYMFYFLMIAYLCYNFKKVTVLKSLCVVVLETKKRRKGDEERENHLCFTVDQPNDKFRVNNLSNLFLSVPYSVYMFFFTVQSWYRFEIAQSLICIVVTSPSPINLMKSHSIIPMYGIKRSR